MGNTTQPLRGLKMAYKQTYILFGDKEEEYCFGHVDRKGKTIKQYNFEKKVMSILMLSYEKVLVILAQDENIVVINLISQKETKVPFKFEGQVKSLCLFKQTDLICICEKGFPSTFGRSQIRLTYFNIDRKEEFQYRFYIGGKEQLNKNRVTHSKANSHSLVYFVESGFSSNCQILFKDLEIENTSVSLRTRSVKINKIQGSARADIHLWQTKYKQLFVAPYFLLGQELCIYLINFAGQVLKTIKPQVTRDNILGVLLIEGVFCFSKELLKSSYYSYVPQKSRQYYHFLNADSNKHEFLMKERWPGRKVFGIDEFGKTLFCLEENKDVNQNGQKEMRFEKLKPFELKQIFMSFLLHLNEDFDDDLLFDSIGLLDSE